MLDPAVHLKGATPEKLAKALFRRTGPLPARTQKKGGSLRPRPGSATSRAAAGSAEPDSADRGCT